mmetsp:Transcript_3557/g.3989  ORF Transcript_3557/g.3989 Transcript_3557/m.3989 type:complete len:264 (-) Transcript_3557:1025-1816(-)|eukprot:CAMPEP_0197860300 /NCGR_PEP_ID=MMETSP1438-20131217/35564_1 /TAXON_ID=1461541 /ORGANISM="Pterosperma sp., Strain CCMP1384" /LENGTH=263 /DNA_ID=CAMNT_0043477107 /DNA_START=179 /DNA_END=970 /DNA_ORIENTATION=+
MRAICDNCESRAATWFCPADEAALCDSCDVEIHNCNRLAMSHVRVLLTQPPSAPRCKGCDGISAAFFSCAEHGTRLCFKCDSYLHANEDNSNPPHQRTLVITQNVQTDVWRHGPRNDVLHKVLRSSDRFDSTSPSNSQVDRQAATQPPYPSHSSCSSSSSTASNCCRPGAQHTFIVREKRGPAAPLPPGPISDSHTPPPPSTAPEENGLNPLEADQLEDNATMRKRCLEREDEDAEGDDAVSSPKRRHVAEFEKESVTQSVAL